MVLAKTKVRRGKAKAERFKRGLAIRKLAAGVKRGETPVPRTKRPSKKAAPRQRVRLGDIRSIVGRKKAPIVAKALKEALKEFGQGEVIRERSVSSSWVSMIHLVKWQGRPVLGVTFHNQVSVVYIRTGIRDYEQMSGSPSKGKYIWRALYHGVPRAGSPYTIVVF